MNSSLFKGGHHCCAELNSAHYVFSWCIESTLSRWTVCLDAHTDQPKRILHQQQQRNHRLSCSFS
ncbi:hypothetical protein TYRP_021351 [Tyrophagus putrescentiae]|nr:hypothetical protein TYRP_021351 [Tyrophagus putrescentiae]